MKHHVGEQVDGAPGVLLQYAGVESRVFLIGVSIETAAHFLEAVKDDAGAAPLCSLEGHVLAEVGQSVVARRLIARSGFYLIAAIHDGRVHRHADDAQTVA